MTEGDGHDQVDAVAEPVGVIDGAATPRRRRGRVGLWCALVAVSAGAVGLVGLRHPVRTPDQELARVRQFVRTAGTARFAGTSRSESGNGTEEAGSTSIDVTKVDGSFSLPDRLRMVEDSGDSLSETITVKAGTYTRDADTRAGLDAQPWVFEAGSPGGEHDVVDVAAGGLDPAGGAVYSADAGVLGSFGGPFDLAAILGRLHAVRRVSPGVLEAKTTARDLIPPKVVASIEAAAAREKAALAAHAADATSADPGLTAGFDGSFADFLDTAVTIRLVHAADGRLDELTVITERGTGQDRSVDHSTMRFSGWGDPVSITAPALDKVDLTPEIDEESIAAFSAFTVLAPRSLPPGLRLVIANTSEDDVNNKTCNGVELGYNDQSTGPPAGDTLSTELGPGPYLDLSLTQAACMDARPDIAGGTTGPAEPLQVGGAAAELTRPSFPDFGIGDGTTADPVLHVRYTIGDVRVDAESTLPRDQLVAALASLGPIDIATQPIDRQAPPS